MFRIGLDIGCSALKYAIVDTSGALIASGLKVHRGSLDNALLAALDEMEDTVQSGSFLLGITGELAERYPAFSAFHINEASAITKAVQKTYPAARSIMEISAQRAKYISGFASQTTSSFTFAMNGSCASGTGAFIEEQLQRLSISFEQFDQMAGKAKSIPGIAGRCSVFSKTDMIHQQQSGVPLEDILLGLVYALVRNYKSNVVQKHPVQKPVLLAGGVTGSAHVVKALQALFDLKDEDIIRPVHLRHITAIGAALSASEEKLPANLAWLKENLRQDRDKAVTTSKTSLADWGSNDSVDKHKVSPVITPEGYLGIDIGSTSTNLVVIDNDTRVVYSTYLRTAGKPLEAVEQGLADLKEKLGHEFTIKGIGTTGSGRVFIGKKLSADLVIDEITAQARGAVHSVGDVDTILEIGGQDSKYIQVKNGLVTDFEMNKICAAGTGAFIEEQIKKLDIPLSDFEAIALKSSNPSDLGDRCTVFIEGNITKALAIGETKEDIAAGLAFSIVSNYLNRVVGSKPIGEKILLQGGIAFNQAIINAFRATLQKEVTVPAFFSVTGALGTALLTKEKMHQAPVQESSDAFDIDQLSQAAFLRGYNPVTDPSKKTIGIPRVLFLNKMFPLFHEVFTTLGFNVLLSKPTDEEIIALSQQYSLDETCFPIKLVNGHVASLIEQKVDYIFLPSLYTMKNPGSHSCNYACVYMQSVAKLADQAIDFKSKGITLLAPALSFDFGKLYMLKELLQLGKSLNKSKPQMMFALMKGIKRFTAYGKELEDIGRDYLARLAPTEKAFILISRTYNIADPRLNMQIAAKLREKGHKVIELAHIPAHDLDISEDYPNMYWPFGQHALAGIRITNKHPLLFPIYITNHGCGPDTVISHFFKDEAASKPFLHLEVDEHFSSVGVMTRLEAFVNSVENYCRHNQQPLDQPSVKKVLPPSQKMLIPYLYPYSTLLSAFFTRQGTPVLEMIPTGQESMALGKKLSVTKEYLPMIALAGDALYNSSKQSDTAYSLFIPSSEGSEVSGQYSTFVEKQLQKQGYPARIVAPLVENCLGDSAYGYEAALLVTAGDLIMAADQEDRALYLQEFLQRITNDSLTEQALLDAAAAIAAKNSQKSSRKRLSILGDFAVIYNPFLNGSQLAALEKNHKLIYQPLAESLLFLTLDKLEGEKKNSLSRKNASKLTALLKNLALLLAKDSPFETDISSLLHTADDTLGLYAGGAGRYRMSKLFYAKERAAGIINVSPMYENTATILKILSKAHEEKIALPVLELQFDHNNHTHNKILLDTFIGYL